MSNDNMQNYCKPALSIDQQLDLLALRGLTISDRNKARHYLKYIGYHRLSGYFLHARLWNRQFSIKPIIMKAYQKQLGRNYTFYAQAAMLYVLMYIIADGSKWQSRLSDLLEKHPNVFIRAMGFPENWKEDPFWRMI